MASMANMFCGHAQSQGCYSPEIDVPLGTFCGSSRSNGCVTIINPDDPVIPGSSLICDTDPPCDIPTLDCDLTPNQERLVDLVYAKTADLLARSVGQVPEVEKWRVWLEVRFAYALVIESFPISRLIRSKAICATLCFEERPDGVLVYFPSDYVRFLTIEANWFNLGIDELTNRTDTRYLQSQVPFMGPTTYRPLAVISPTCGMCGGCQQSSVGALLQPKPTAKCLKGATPKIELSYIPMHEPDQTCFSDLNLLNAVVELAASRITGAESEFVTSEFHQNIFNQLSGAA